MSKISTVSSLLLLSILATGCELIADIFEAGYYTGLFMVFVVILLILFLIGYFRKK